MSPARSYPTNAPTEDAQLSRVIWNSVVLVVANTRISQALLGSLACDRTPAWIEGRFWSAQPRVWRALLQELRTKHPLRKTGTRDCGRSSIHLPSQCGIFRGWNGAGRGRAMRIGTARW